MVYLVHHADAVPPDVDSTRPLSPRGREHAEALAQEAARRGVKPDAIWHSGKVRARQTAEAFRRACHPLASFSALRGLQPTDPPEWLRDHCAGETRTVMAVGHMPNLARVLRLMLGGDADTSPIAFPLHGMVALEPVEERWKEIWRID